MAHFSYTNAYYRLAATTTKLLTVIIGLIATTESRLDHKQEVFDEESARDELIDADRNGSNLCANLYFIEEARVPLSYIPGCGTSCSPLPVRIIQELFALILGVVYSGSLHIIAGAGQFR
ncbi:hypothetical protein F4859DRAFT_517189 [Xylaria cf. heliscus]|nr:hypothetical protein F4859DRAFT_517189 [Xylaria cf. heliscus]